MTVKLEGGFTSDPNQRLTAWQIRSDTARVREMFDDFRPEMLERYKAAVAGICETETNTKTRQTLNAPGVHTIMYVPRT